MDHGNNDLLEAAMRGQVEAIDISPTRLPQVKLTVGSKKPYRLTKRDRAHLRRLQSRPGWNWQRSRQQSK